MHNVDHTPLVMVVDDEWLNRELMEGVLHLYQYQVLLASNGEQAIQMAQKQVPDLVLLDVKMPNMSGFEVCRRLKTNPQTHNAVVVMVSGLEGSPEEKAAALDAGADDFVNRMLPIETLMERIQNLLNNLPSSND